MSNSTSGSAMPENSSSRNRSDSLENAGLLDEEQQRKRPRLDCVEGSQQAEIDSRSHGNDDHDMTPSIQPHSATASPTSKVTINTRSLPSPIKTQPLESDSAHFHNMGPANHQVQNLAEEAVIDCAPEDVISISSSPEESPEIQVAELEDLDQDSSETKWTQVTHISNNPFHAPDFLQRTFPHYDQLYDHTRGVMSLRKMMHVIENEATAKSDEVLLRVKGWIGRFLECHPQMAPDRFTDEQDFWRELPDLVTGVLRRDFEFSDVFRPRDLRRLFVDFARLTVLFVEMDLKFLQNLDATADPRAVKDISELVSTFYLHTMGYILQPRAPRDSIPLYRTLRSLKSEHWDPVNIVSEIVDELALSGHVNMLRALNGLLDGVAPLIISKPGLCAPFRQAIAVASSFTASLVQSWTAESDDLEKHATTLSEAQAEATNFFRKTNEIIETAIVKQSSWLTIESSNDFLENAATGFQMLSYLDHDFGREVVRSAGVVSCIPEPVDYQGLIHLVWKFKTFRKYLTSGRMELRVHGVENMQGDLVNIYKGRVLDNDNFACDPVVQFCISFLQDNKFISYIIGVDSHPQLITRSFNIVGFLCVSGSYQNADTDAMWRSVLESQDPRTGGEVLSVMRGVSTLVQEPAILLHFCTHLLALPVERLDAAMIDFMSSVLHYTKLRTSPPKGIMDARPIQLCVRLLRDAHASRVCSAEQIRLICAAASAGLGSLRHLQIAEDAEGAMWDQCMADIATNAASATGSFDALNVWLLPSEAMKRGFGNPSDFAHAVTTNLVHFVTHHAAELSDPQCSLRHDLESRLATMSWTMVEMPESISNDLLDNLWSNVYVQPIASEFSRQLAWDSLTGVIDGPSTQRNKVVDAIIDDFVPQLRSNDFSTSVLTFLQYSVNYDARFRSPEPVDDEEVIGLPGIDRIWRVMLEAPSGSVENVAADFIIAQYLDNDLVTRRSKSSIEATHLSLIDRCVTDVIRSAARLKSYTDGTTSGEDEPMVMIASEAEIQNEELRFDRSLLFLRKFLQGIKARPSYSPPQSKQVELPRKSLDTRGETFVVFLQTFGGNRANPHRRRMILGWENTGQELWQYLSEITGFTEFRCHAAGQTRHIQNESQTLRELGLNDGALLISKIENTPENIPHRSARASSPVDNKVLNHFGELYDLLDLNERLAKEVFGFLSLFPAQFEVLDSIRGMDVPAEEVLPADKPYKLLYCARALRSCIEAESFSSDPDTDLLQYGITVLVATFGHLERSGTGEDLNVLISHHLLEILLLAFRAKVPSAVSQHYIDDPDAFVNQTLRMLENARLQVKTTAANNTSTVLVYEPFEVLIEGVLHDPTLWQQLHLDTRIQRLLKTILLDSRQSDVRKAVSQSLMALSGVSGAKLVLKVNDPRAPKSRFPAEVIEATLVEFWAPLVSILPEAVLEPSRCQEFFDVLLAIFRRIGKSLDTSHLQTDFEDWSHLLAHHNHEENVGHESEDYAVQGLAKLLLECCKYLRSNEGPVPPNDLPQIVLSKFLFPPLSDDAPNPADLHLPVLEGAVREDLYELVLALTRTEEDLHVVTSALEDTIAKDMFFEPQILHGRQNVRSEVGYAGLRNLTNTCYLNSLFSQLFMNVKFRDFILGVNILDASKQALAVELGKVFGHMQNSYEQWIDPTSAIESISTYDNEQIDIAIQMDVDEFFNLLFDRLESQILAPDAKKTFKSFYGGQLVQQVKSKECEHISERIEPFSAVQVEIKGKISLEDSLRAYVDGEVLQGDNKYSCTSCARHVDAVKRACLKDIPDNLIFNLKRFDYDIMTGMRCKVNDEFQFPEVIDMSPYTVEYLSQTNPQTESDLFELVGVIIHAGTADSGHYYSYSRQRPCAKAQGDSWVQFNDTDVSAFDPAGLRDCCFGGVDPTSHFPYPKIYNAYMLFYQRATSITKMARLYTQHDSKNPVRLPLPPDLDQHIMLRNELYLRSYCAQDPSHAKFIRKLLERFSSGDRRACSEKHVLESKILETALDYVHQISSRFRDLPEFETTMSLLLQQASKCLGCSRATLVWLLQDDNIRDALVRSMNTPVRRHFAMLLCKALEVMRNGPGDQRVVRPDSGQPTRTTKAYKAVLERCVQVLVSQWELLQRCGRAWDDYFELIDALFALGHWEAGVVLHHEYLPKVLDIVMLHHGPPSRRARERNKTYLAMKEKNRLFHYRRLLDFLASMLECVELADFSHSDDEHRGGVRERYQITSLEATQLGMVIHPTQELSFKFDWLKRAAIGRQNAEAVSRIVKRLATDPFTAADLRDILQEGLTDSTISAAAAFLSPTIVFCSHCADVQLVKKLVKVSLEEIGSISFEHGQDYLDFVKEMMQLSNARVGWTHLQFSRHVLAHIGDWAPVLLLFPSELHADVKGETKELLRQYVLDPLEAPDTDEEIKRLLRQSIHQFLSAAVKYVRSYYFPPGKDRLTLQADQANVFVEVMEYCAEHHYGTTDARSEANLAKVQEFLADLKARADAAAAETLSSSWPDNDSDLNEMSEFDNTELTPSPHM